MRVYLCNTTNMPCCGSFGVGVNISFDNFQCSRFTLSRNTTNMLCHVALVLEWQGPIGTEVCHSPWFSASGVFWKWTIKSRYGDSHLPVQIGSVEFAQRAGGTKVRVYRDVCG